MQSLNAQLEYKPNTVNKIVATGGWIMKFLKINKEKWLMTIYIIVIILGVAKTYFDAPEVVTTFAMPTNKKIVVIDAGHGGWDPGKVSRTGVEEKDINLLIAEKLQILLEQSGAYVIVTRDDDVALAADKRDDLYNRRSIADKSKADIFISIHQNSYPAESVRGAQAFYYGDSEHGTKLAAEIQKQISTYLEPKNKRPSQANTNYYVLKKTLAPSVLVECGFLSNYSDTKKLTTDEYQERVAWTIYMGIVNYFADEAQVN